MRIDELLSNSNQTVDEQHLERVISAGALPTKPIYDESFEEPYRGVTKVSPKIKQSIEMTPSNASPIVPRFSGQPIINGSSVAIPIAQSVEIPIND